MSEGLTPEDRNALAVVIFESDKRFARKEDLDRIDAEVRSIGGSLFVSYEGGPSIVSRVGKGSGPKGLIPDSIAEGRTTLQMLFEVHFGKVVVLCLLALCLILAVNKRFVDLVDALVPDIHTTVEGDQTVLLPAPPGGDTLAPLPDTVDVKLVD